MEEEGRAEREAGTAEREARAELHQTSSTMEVHSECTDISFQ